MLTLAPRQLDVMRLVAKGWQDKEVAAYLGVQTQTVKSCLWEVYRKVGATNRVEALVRLGWVTVPPEGGPTC